jgi:hypothetical protein
MEHGAHAKHVVEVNDGVVAPQEVATKKKVKAVVVVVPAAATAHDENREEPLHPSWEAKKKQRVTIAAGMDSRANKTVFGEDGDAAPPTPTPTQATSPVAKRAPVVLRKVAAAVAPVNDNLHPSWVAKQKEKSRLADMLRSAKNTKVVFE